MWVRLFVPTYIQLSLNCIHTRNCREGLALSVNAVQAFFSAKGNL
jgi:hypothetical protein